MTTPLVTFLIPFGIVIAVGAAIRLAARAFQPPVAAGISLLLGMAVAWQWVIESSWAAGDDVSRIIHIILGGVLLGLALDMKPLRGFWIAAAMVIFGLVVAWTSIAGGLTLAVELDGPSVLRFAVYSGVILFLLWRLEGLRPQAPTALATLMMAAFGLLLVAIIAGQERSADVAAALSACLAGLFLWSWILAVPIGTSAILGAGGGIAGLAFALLAPGGANAVAVLLVVLVLPFAEGTARRIPLGPAALRPVTLPMWLIAVSLLPIVLAVTVQYVAASP